MASPPLTPRLSRRTFLVQGAAVAAGAVGLVACGNAPPGPRGGDAADTAGVDPETQGDGVGPEGFEAGETTEASETAETGETETSDGDSAEVDVSPPRFDPSDYPEASESLFPVGVTSTDPIVGGALLATRYTGTATVDLVVWRLDGAGPDGVLALERPAAVADAGFVIEDVRDLMPGAEHRFVFLAGARRSPVGRFRTAPEADARPVVVLGASSCAKWDFRPFDVLTRAAEANLDLFLLLGDTTYADSATTLDAYRENWARNLGSVEYRALRTSTTCAATWDDHEVDNNWTTDTVDLTRLGIARQAFFEHMAVRRSEAAPDRIWRAIRWGATVEIFILDCRSERRPTTRDTPEAEYISEAQLAWLDAGLHASTATFKLVLSSVPITRWPVLYPGKDERWEGYAAQRERVLALAADVPGLLWLAGDFHFGAFTTVDPPGGTFATQREVLVGPIAHLNPGLAIVELSGSPAQFPRLTGARNYGRFTLDPSASPPTITVELVDANGAILGTQVLSFA